MKISSYLACGIALAMIAGNAQAANYEVDQKGKKFSKPQLTIHKGDTITFKNDDPFFHNIFSLSAVQSFDVGTFSTGETRQVQFDKLGVVDVECAIHPEMKLKVEVTK